MNDQIGVTVVVPTLNRDNFLPNTLRDLIAQEHRPLEILIVDQSDSIPDSVQQIVNTHSDLISYHQVSFRGLPLARNYGWQNARYEAIVYVDDDIRCSPKLVTEHLRTLQLPNVGAVAGGIIERNRPEQPAKRAGNFRYWTAIPEHGFHLDGAYNTDSVKGCNFSIWRYVAAEIDGFDENLNVGAALYEETEFSLRVGQAGYRVYYNSEAKIDHLAAPSGGCRVDEVEDYVWALAHNRIILIRRHLQWYQQPVAFVELLRLGLAYAAHYRKLGAIQTTITGGLAGYKDT